MGKFDGRVVLITGGGRGQGRSHALAFANEGADIIAMDVARQLPTVPYEMSSDVDLKETKRVVEDLGRDCYTAVADARDTDAMNEVVAAGIEKFGKIDVLIANHGIVSMSHVADMTDDQWEEVLSVCLTGVFKAARAVLPHMIEQNYGRIVATSSVAAKAGLGNIAHYVAAKLGIIGLIKSIAAEVANNGITANVVCPTACNTDMLHNDANYVLFQGWDGGDSLPEGPLEFTDEVRDGLASINMIDIPFIQPYDISRAMVFLADEESRYITGAVLNVAAGAFHGA